MEKMDWKEYIRYREAIDIANSTGDKDTKVEALRRIYLELITRYGAGNDDVRQLYDRFRYSVRI